MPRGSQQPGARRRRRRAARRRPHRAAASPRTTATRPRRGQAAVRREVRLLPHPQPRRQGRHRAQPRRGLPAVPDGFGATRIEGVVHGRSSTRAPAIGTGVPAKIVTGEDARRTSPPTSRYAAAKRGRGRRLLAVGAALQAEVGGGAGGKLENPADPERPAAYVFKQRRGARRPARRSTRATSPRSRTTSPSRATASTRRASRPGRRRLEVRPTSGPASTRSSAPSRATARAAWRARSPSSSGARPRRAGRRRARPRRRRRGRAAAARAEEERQREHHQHDVERDHHPARRLLVGERVEAHARSPVP